LEQVLPYDRDGLAGAGLAREISLSPLTVLPCGPLEQIDAAVAAGFQTVGLRLLPVMTTDVAIMEDPALMRAIAERISQTGLSVLDVEVVRVNPRLDVSEVLPVLDFAAELGARWLAVTADRSVDYRSADEPALVRKLAELADAANERGLGVMLEFMVFRGVATLEDAVRVVTAVDRPNMRICLDVLHLFRSGGDLQLLRRLDPSLLACVQLNDAPASAPDDVQREARYDRLLPGRGEFPLRDLLDALPAEIPLAIEVPAESVDSADKRARDAMQAFAELMQ